MRNPFLISILAAAALTTNLPGQRQDPARELQEIARRVEEQLQEIDRLLLESGKQGQGREKPRELLQRAKQRSDDATVGIDQLIEKLQDMKSKGSGQGEPQPGDEPRDGQGQPDPSDGQSSPSQGKSGGKRRENATPDFQQQQQPEQQSGTKPEPGQGQPQPQEQRAGQAQAGQETPLPPDGPSGQPVPADPTAAGQPGQGEGSWGNLQEYEAILKNRGSRPKVPEKFRKYWEAYLKQKAEERK
jgi:hypothetical protein